VRKRSLELEAPEPGSEATYLGAPLTNRAYNPQVLSLAGDECDWATSLGSGQSRVRVPPRMGHLASGGYSSSTDEGERIDLRRRLDFEGRGCRCSTSEIPDQYRSDRPLRAPEHTL
jgi:hypothetical protein